MASEKSPYLLQHANNPVNWYPWSEEAYSESKKASFRTKETDFQLFVYPSACVYASHKPNEKASEH
ncbi:DUF255 domain-containing protein [Desulfosporosinus sp. OT]|uniref:DUF255 domain-containing protein n=1 Tax=Desulfosporosinus sp. OT TaxID=913865 RepID=UPI00249DA262|nr:DUF255 domain-containing protein [Desulfosporosinus sp. OT]